MPVSEELKKLLEENKLNKKRPTGAQWTCGKRWDRIQTVKRNLKKLYEENEVQYAIFLTCPNPKGDPSYYQYTEGEEIQKLMRDQRNFSKSFLELRPKWNNSPTFAYSVGKGTRKRLHSHENAEDDPAEENDLPDSPDETGILAQDADTGLAAGSQINHNIAIEGLIQEDGDLFQNQEKDRLKNLTEPEPKKKPKKMDFLKDLRQELYREKQKKYSQAKYKRKKQYLPRGKRQQPKDPSDINQETSAKKTIRQNLNSFASTTAEEPDVDGTAKHEIPDEEIETIIVYFNLEENDIFPLESTNCQDIT